MEGLREGYEFYIKSSVAFVGGARVDAWARPLADGIDAEIGEFAKNLERYIGSSAPIDSLGGYIAEEWHAGTFNVAAAARGSVDRASIPSANGLGSIDVRLESGTSYSSKYYKTPKASLKEQAITFKEKAGKGSAEARKAIEFGRRAEGDLLYEGQRRLIPSDQLDEARRLAERLGKRNESNRPEQAARYRRTGDVLVDHIENEEGVESRPLTKRDSRKLAEEARAGKVDFEKHGVSKSQYIELESVMRKSLKAGMSAAAVAAALAAAPALIEALDHLVRTGEADVDKLAEGGMDALNGGARGFLIGASCAAIVGLAESGRLGHALEDIDPSVVGAASVVIVGVLVNSVKVAAGKMEPAEMADALVRDSLVAVASVATGTAGSALGAVALEALASKMTGGIAQILLPQLPAVGYLLGSFVGSAAAGIAYAAGKQAFVALCVESGFTAFGLVEQDYELPESALREIGVEVLEYESMMPEMAEPERIAFETVVPDMQSPESVEMSFVRRGVIGVAMVGYATQF